MLSEKVLKWCKQKKRTIPEIMEKFEIPQKSYFTVLRDVKKQGVVLRENRGRKKKVFG